MSSTSSSPSKSFAGFSSCDEDEYDKISTPKIDSLSGSPLPSGTPEPKEEDSEFLNETVKTAESNETSDIPNEKVVVAEKEVVTEKKAEQWSQIMEQLFIKRGKKINDLSIEKENLEKENKKLKELLEESRDKATQKVRDADQNSQLEKLKLEILERDEKLKRSSQELQDKDYTIMGLELALNISKNTGAESGEAVKVKEQLEELASRESTWAEKVEDLQNDLTTRGQALINLRKELRDTKEKLKDVENDNKWIKEQVRGIKRNQETHPTEPVTKKSYLGSSYTGSSYKGSSYTGSSYTGSSYTGSSYTKLSEEFQYRESITESKLRKTQEDLEAAYNQMTMIVDNNNYIRAEEANKHSQEVQALRLEIAELNANITLLKQW